jgi:hypothetical protein
MASWQIVVVSYDLRVPRSWRKIEPVRLFIMEAGSSLEQRLASTYGVKDVEPATSE